MFIRASSQKDKKTGGIYTTYRLVESYRNQSGKVRQQTLLNLGSHFDLPKKDWAELVNRIEEINGGQETLLPVTKAIETEARRISKLISKKHSIVIPKEINSKKNKSTDFQSIDVNSLSHEDVRRIGCEHVAYHAAQQLNLHEILDSLGFNAKQIGLAFGAIIGRLVKPGSELATHRYLKDYSSLDELLGTDFSNLSLKNLYKISDHLLKDKKNIENALYQREKDLFNLKEVVTLYDLTNTYFEGNCSGNSKAQRGRSKEKRNDCCLVTLGMVLDSSGFAKKSTIFPGNIGEPTTLKEMLRELNGDKSSIIVMDAGIASEENITWLSSSGYEYIVVSRKQKLVMPTNVDPVLVKETLNNRVTTCLVENEKTNELELYCHSTAKEAKSNQMASQFTKRYLDELMKLSNGLTKKGGTKKYEKVVERVGRLKEKYSKIAKLYDVTIKPDENNNKTIGITWEKKKNSEKNNKQPGTYCLRTNKKGLGAEEFWNLYTMLTDIEAAFRSLKSELGMRPVFHQKESRVDGHLFISILAYHLLHTIRYQLKAKGINESWETLRELLSSQIRITSTLNLENGGSVKIRKTSKADPNQVDIYNALGITSQPGEAEKTYF